MTPRSSSMGREVLGRALTVQPVTRHRTTTSILATRLTILGLLSVTIPSLHTRPTRLTATIRQAIIRTILQVVGTIHHRSTMDPITVTDLHLSPTKTMSVAC